MIELLITLSIVGMMAVLAIPAFENYGKRAAFKQKMEEVKGLLDRTSVLARSPEKGQDRYLSIVSSNSSDEFLNYVGLSKFLVGTDGAIPSSNIINNMAMDPDIYEITKTKNALVCQSPGEFCCLVDTYGRDDRCGISQTSSSEITFFTVRNKKTDQTATFSVRGNPYSSNLVITP